MQDLNRITKEEEYEFKELFDVLDYNKKGVVEPAEIISVLKSNSIFSSLLV